MKALTSTDRSVNRLARCCVGSIFVAFVSAVIVYAFHGWTWPSEINGVALNLPEFAALVGLLTFVVGTPIDYWRTKRWSSVKVSTDRP